MRRVGNRHTGQCTNVCVDCTRRVNCAVAVSICHVSRWSKGACGSKLDNSSICLSYEQELMGMSYHVSTHIVYLRKRGGGSDGHASPKVPKSHYLSWFPNYVSLDPDGRGLGEEAPLLLSSALYWFASC